MIFKAFRGCTEQKEYQATTEDVPVAFLDGTRSGGEVGSLWIAERAGPGGAHVRIQARHIGTSIIVRQVARYLTFAVRMPEDMLDYAEESGELQLCLHGCPRSELIKEHTLSRQSPRPRLQGSAAPAAPGPAAPPPQSYTVALATAKCREILQVEDVYFQSCVFDLLTTGDPEFSMAAYGALEDLKALPPSRLKQNAPRTPRLSNSAGPLPESSSHALPLLAAFVLALILS